MTKTYEIEYEEAPCGYVTFYNYKEPLMKFTEGYGFMGALVFDGKTDQIQCHLCGEWFGSLGHHLAREHNMKASAYKEKVGLLQTTALVSESARAKMIANGLEKRKRNLIPGKKKTQEEKDKISRTLRENAEKAEGMNLKGTCPAQIIDRMQKIAQEKGDKLKMKDFKTSLCDLAKKTYGSVKEACKIAGINYREPGKTLKNDLVKPEERRESLLEDLRRFERINGRRPSTSDTKRNLVPSWNTYRKHFGSWKKAYKLAFNN
jgi:hypothetical protein